MSLGIRYPFLQFPPTIKLKSLSLSVYRNIQAGEVPCCTVFFASNHFTQMERQSEMFGMKMVLITTSSHRAPGLEMYSYTMLNMPEFNH